MIVDIIKHQEIPSSKREVSRAEESKIEERLRKAQQEVEQEVQKRKRELEKEQVMVR